jgi:signal transduction histidine kinase/HD-like signal output (HDOD) protein
MDASTPQAQHVELILRRLDALPTLSPIATRILQLGSDDKAEISEVASLIESDPALTVRILGLCRKADRGVGTRITTVRRAVVMLGLEAVQSAVLGVSVFELLDGQSEQADRVGLARGVEPSAYDFDRRGFWQHALGVACAAELLAEQCRELKVGPDEAFVAGLLHGLGRLVLSLLLPQAYRRVIEACEKRQSAAAPLERSIIGMDNHVAGKRICEHWGLPTPIADTIWLHSQSAASLPDVPHKALIEVVTIARGICRQIHLGWSGDCDPPPNVESLSREVRVDPDRVRRIIPKLHEAVSTRCTVLGLDRSDPPDLLLQSVSNANRRLSRANRALEERARASSAQQEALRAIARFCEHAGAPESRNLAQAHIGRSARALLGEGYIAILTPAGRTWEMLEIAPDGEPGMLTDDEAPRDFDDAAALSDLAHSPAAAGAVATWVIAHASRRLRTWSLRAVSLGRASRPSALLLFDNGDAGGEGIAERLGEVLDALRASWGAALLAGEQQEAARRVGEQLAEASRILAETQARLTEAESLARLGEMTAGAAHEMNNPLAVISGRGQLLASRLGDTPDGASARAIVEATRDLAELITSLHLLAAPPEPTWRATTIGEVADLALGLVAMRRGGPAGDAGGLEPIPAIGAGSAIDADAQTRAVAATCDPDLLAQALAELVLNSAESAGPAAPPVAITLRAQTDPVDRRLVLTVADTGPGLSPRALRHAFDPFFSEKPAGRQRGLGLPRARRLVQLLDGTLTLENGPRGALARITLPSAMAGRARAA